MGTNSYRAGDGKLPQVEAAHLISCGSCGLLSRAPADARRSELFCPRCRAALHLRKPHSLLRTWILLIAGALCYLPANLLPITVSTSFGSRQADTIISGVIYFINTGSFPIAIIIFVASIVVPMIKLLSLCFLALSVQFKSRWRPEERTLLYRITETIGRWSMMDIFVVMVVVALVRMQAVATIEVGPGAFFFGAVVILTMLAARAFDPRLIWDAMQKQPALKSGGLGGTLRNFSWIIPKPKRSP